MYGFQRVISPKGAVPQAADKVDNTLTILDSTEVVISVDCLNLDSTSMRQIKESGKDIGAQINAISKKESCN